MGFFRLALAILVMLSHLPGTWGGANYGQMAVLGFYFVSGYLMAMIYTRFKVKSRHPTRDFFIDRVFKLWPSYLLVIGATVVFLDYTGIRQVRFVDLIPELLLAPAAFGKLFQYPYSSYLVPPAWSLGVELHFYLVVPLLAVLSYRAKIALAYVLTGAHLTVLSSAKMVSDFIPVVWPFRTTITELPVSDYFGFDLPFIIFVVFLLGNLSFEKFIVRKSSDPHLYVLWAIYAFSLFFVFPYKGWIFRLSVRETLLSITLFAPIALAVLVATASTKPNVYDRIAGALAYPLFLVHCLARDVIVYFFGAHGQNAGMILQSIALAFVLAAIVAVFQVWVADRGRYWARGFGSSLRIRISGQEGPSGSVSGAH